MRRKAPWFPFYAADWNGDEQVRLLSLEAQGAYVRLLAHSWIERSIPADPDSIGVLLGDRRLGKKIWPALARFWEPKADEPGRLVNARLERERRAQDDYSAAQRERGKRGNESQVRTQVRTDGDRGGGAHAVASAYARGPQTRSQVAPQSDRSVQSESEPKPEKEIGSLSVHPRSTQPPRAAGAERASLSASHPSENPEETTVDSEAFANTLDEPMRSQLLASVAKVRAEKAQRTASKPNAIDTLARGVYGEART